MSSVSVELHTEMHDGFAVRCFAVSRKRKMASKLKKSKEKDEVNIWKTKTKKR